MNSIAYSDDKEKMLFFVTSPGSLTQQLNVLL